MVVDGEGEAQEVGDDLEVLEAVVDHVHAALAVVDDGVWLEVVALVVGGRTQPEVVAPEVLAEVEAPEVLVEVEDGGCGVSFALTSCHYYVKSEKRNAMERSVRSYPCIYKVIIEGFRRL